MILPVVSKAPLPLLVLGLSLAVVKTPTLRWVSQGSLHSVDPWLLADLFGLLQEVANNMGLPPKDPLSLLEARSIPLPIVALTQGEDSPLLLLAATPHLPLLFMGRLPRRLFSVRIPFLVPGGQRVAGRGSDHFSHGSAFEADSYIDLEEDTWGKCPVLSQRPRSFATLPYIHSKDTVSTGVWPGSSSALLAQFNLFQFHCDWDSYLLFGLWADNRMMRNPDTIICIEEWITNLSDNGGGKLATAKDPVTHEDNVSSHCGFCWGEDRDPSINRWNKTLSVDSLMSQTSAGTPSPMHQLFLGAPSPVSRKPTEATLAIEVDIEL